VKAVILVGITITINIIILKNLTYIATALCYIFVT